MDLRHLTYDDSQTTNFLCKRCTGMLILILYKISHARQQFLDNDLLVHKLGKACQGTESVVLYLPRYINLHTGNTPSCSSSDFPFGIVEESKKRCCKMLLHNSITERLSNLAKLKHKSAE